jgi:hypothetical protein
MEKVQSSAPPPPPRAYWCPRAKRFIAPGQRGYDEKEFERLALGPIERGSYELEEWD